MMDPPIQRQRPMSILKKASLKARVEEMIKKGKIGTSVSGWNSPPNMVSYPERIAEWLRIHEDSAAHLFQEEFRQQVKDLFRLTHDFRKLNEFTMAARFPLPRISDLLDRCSGSNRYSSGDVEDAFFTIWMEEASRQYTAFQTPDSTLEYHVLSMGFKCAAMKWAEVVHDAFQHMQGEELLYYQDDILCNGTREASDDSGQELRNHAREWYEVQNKEDAFKLFEDESSGARDHLRG